MSLMDNNEESANVQNEKGRMESTGRNSISLSSEGPSTSRKRKLINGSELHLDSLKAEIERLKELNEIQAKTISNQAVTITRLQDKAESWVDDDTDDDQSEFQDRIDQLESKCNDYQLRFNELEAQLQGKSNIETSLQTKINEMEQKCDHQKKLHETEIGKLTSAVEEQVKKIKDLDAQLLSKKNTEEDLLQKFDEMKQHLNEQRRSSEAKTCELDAIIEEQEKKMEELKIKLESKEKESKGFVADQELMLVNYKDELKKNKELKKQHVKEMEELNTEMQAKINENTKIYEYEIERLKLSHEDFMKAESENHQTILQQYQNAIKILNWKVNFSYAETDFKAKISKLERKSQIIYEKIADREKKIRDLENGRKQKEPECITLD